MDSAGGSFFLLFLLLLFSGVFSGAETAIMSLEMSKIKSLKVTQEKSATRAEWLKNHPQKVIITLLIMNNLLNTLITVLATILATSLVSGGTNSEAIMGGVTLVISIFLIIFGDVLPKSIAVAHSQRYTFFIAPFLSFLISIFTPFIFILEKLINLVIPHSPQRVTEEEVLAMISMGQEHGEITKDEKDRIESLLEFGDTTVAEIMTPRTKIQAIEDDKTLKMVRGIMLENGHTRIPVFHEDLDHVINIITIRDILESSEEYEDEKLVKNLDLRSPYFVPITKNISDLFKDFQKRGIHMAIVVDEFGGTAGLVTMEDIFEEIFGEIRDETDDEEEELIRQLDSKTWTVLSRITLDEIYEETGLSIADSEDDYKKSVSLFLLEKLERFPRKGESIEFELATLIVEKVGNKTPEVVRIVQKI